MVMAAVGILLALEEVQELHLTPDRITAKLLVRSDFDLEEYALERAHELRPYAYDGVVQWDTVELDR